MDDWLVLVIRIVCGSLSIIFDRFFLVCLCYLWLERFGWRGLVGS